MVLLDLQSLQIDIISHILGNERSLRSELIFGVEKSDESLLEI